VTSRRPMYTGSKLSNRIIIRRLTRGEDKSRRD